MLFIESLERVILIKTHYYMKWILRFICFCVSIQGFCQGVTFSNPTSVAPAKGYSHAAVIDLGTSRMLVISGQVGLDKQGNVIGKDDIALQTEQVFKNIKAIVEDAGGTMNHLIKLSYFLRDVKQIQSVRDIRNRFINVAQPPASTLVEVSHLFRDDILIEIEATAVIPKR